ncbi:MAG TPA: DinB family protein [Chitinophagaceae bacterium]|nr:DinB family protein [Chitinophagaceae bacterium]
MAIKDALIAELKQESALTKKMLEKVPLEKKDWKPHEKSMALGRLATHIAQTPHWISDIILIDEYDFAARPYLSNMAASQKELMEIFEQHLSKAIRDLENAPDELLNKTWTVRSGEKVFFVLPKTVAIRGWGYSHLIHHRGQLSVYLRLLDVPVPGMYGPSADEKM